MPVFGDYETVGEPIATTPQSDHVLFVWKARKTGERTERFAVRCFAPNRDAPAQAPSTDTLGEDRGLQFLEGVKALKKAGSERGRGVAAVYDFGSSADGVWYVTDFHPRGSLHTWITRRGDVRGAGLRHVVYSVVLGCLALKRSCGRSHGNLSPANVFLVGAKARRLWDTPLALIGPRPASTDQAIQVEKDDLRAIGELILQLVQGRLISGTDDYNWPIEPSKAWIDLGKDGEEWRQLCNLLLDPQLSLATLNLESLANRFRPNPVTAKMPVILAGFAVICLAAAAVYFTLAGSKRAATPTITPNGSNAQDAVQVEVASGTTGAALYYTKDGTEPTTNSPRYSQPFTLTNSATVKAKAFAEGLNPSRVASAKFTVTGTPPPPPTITPNGGDYPDKVLVTLDSGTAGATIRYTVDKTDPTINSPRYSQPFMLTNSATVKARAFVDSSNPSPVASAAFTVTATLPVAQPTITPKGGTNPDKVQVTLASETPGATIHYTVDNTDPTTNSPLYSQPLTLTQSATVKAMAFAAGFNPSLVAGATFTVTVTPPPPPTITPNGGDYRDKVLVTLDSGAPGATIHYTVDGPEPTANSPRYTQPFTLTQSATVKARAFADGSNPSLAASAAFTVTNRPTVAQPTITPSGGTHPGKVQVTLACVTAGATICYTVDGTDPTINSPRYSQPFTLTQPATVKARAFADGSDSSLAASAKFTVTVTPPALVAAAPGQSPEQLLAELEAFKVWFNLRKSDPKIVNPPGYPDADRKAEILGNIDSGREWYKERAAELRKHFETNGPLTPELKSTFDKLASKITNW